MAAGIRALLAAWDHGFAAFCETADLDHAGAADLAFRLGLIPSRWSLTPSQLTALADDRSVTDTEFARRWGVNRRTVAAWRGALGLERRSASRRCDRAGAEPVGDVEVVVGGTTLLAVFGVRLRLGRSARAFVEQLAWCHPDPVDDADLRRAVFPDAPQASAQAALHATVARLRRHLPEGTIVREGSGYRLNIAADAVTRRRPEWGQTPSGTS